MIKTCLVLPVLAATTTLAIAGCGGGGRSSSDPATIAPPKAPVFIEATLQPTGTLKSNVESIAGKVAGIDDLGATIVSEVERSAKDSGEPFDYQQEVEPWLGEKAGIFLTHFDGNNFSGNGIAVQVTDAKEAREFIEKRAKSNSGRPLKDASYEGVDYKVDPSDDTSIGVVGNFIVYGKDEQMFKEAVDASKGESLADVDAYSNAVSAAPGGSLADVYVDVGSLIQQSGSAVGGQALQLLKTAGIEPSDATALASLVPGSDQVEIDVSSDLGGESPPSGDASGLLASFPSDSFAGFAVSGFGRQLEEAIDNLDESGIPPDVPPHKLKSTLSEVGIDLDKIAGSLGDAGVFAEGSSRSSLGGALVLTTKESSEATNTVANIGLLLRNSGTPGVTAVTGKASGFSVRSRELGSKPLVVVAKGERIAVGYGLSAALQGLSSESGATLSGSSNYKNAVAALGDTPISGFVDGPAALRLAESLVPQSERGFQEAKPYLAKVSYIALGSGSPGELATAKLIAGFGE
jgi:hypothetical protein